MRFARFVIGDSNPRYGIVEGDAVVEVEGDILGRYGATDRIHALNQLTFLPPVCPSKIIALGINFKEHAEEVGRPLPKEPRIFLKPPSSLIGHMDAIRLPRVVGAIEHEAELALVVGRRGRNISSDEALHSILGYTCFNDVTARALQEVDGLYTRAKGFDTFGPVGPWIETDAVWDGLVVEGWVNGARRQRGALADTLFPVPTLLAFVSRVMTLEPGDMVVLGTPSGVGPLRPGDQVEVRIEGVGSLVNPVEPEVGE